jgi:hypothetical protein
MKRERYDLTDEEFAAFVDRSSRILEEQEVPHIIVGGTAVQAHMLLNLCKKHNCTIEELVLRDDIRLQDYIRATDDVDMAWKLPKGKDLSESSRQVLSILDSFSGEILSPSENHLIKYTQTRRGIKRPKYRIEINGRSTEEDVIALNISRTSSDLQKLDSKLYERFIQERKKISIPFCSGYDLKLSVVKPEYLIATKISNSRPKDTMDLQNLASIFQERGIKIDKDAIHRILSPKFEKEFARYLTLTNQ